MKTKSSSSPFGLLAVLFAAILVIVAALTMPATAHAAADSVTQVSSLIPQVSPPPFWQSLITGENIAWLLALVGSITTIWKHNNLTTSQKALRAVIVGVEEATKLPAVQAEATKIKQSIQTYAVSHGVQDELHELVQIITDQLPPAPIAPTPAAPATATS